MMPISIPINYRFKQTLAIYLLKALANFVDHDYLLGITITIILC